MPLVYNAGWRWLGHQTFGINDLPAPVSASDHGLRFCHEAVMTDLPNPRLAQSGPSLVGARYTIPMTLGAPLSG